ncbi:MAG: EMC3/TMCO1 family protein [Nanoarchaeota archaeon]
MEKIGSMHKFFFVMSILMVVSLIIAFMWDSLPVVKDSVHSVLNPTLGKLLDWNLTWGMFIIVFLIAVITTMIQKYTTDQETLRQLKKEQKEMQEEMKKFKDNPTKVMEMQKAALPASMKIMELSMRSAFYTIIPFILLFRWFMDYFTDAGNPHFFGFFSWFWFYLIFVIIFSSILRKVFNVA